MDTDTLMKPHIELFAPHNTLETSPKWLFEKVQFFGSTALATWSNSKNTGSYICYILLYELEAQVSC